MTQPAKSEGNAPPDPHRAAPNCPVCDGVMETIYNRGHQKVSVCSDCGSDLTIPTTAWDVLMRKQKRSA